MYSKQQIDDAITLYTPEYWDGPRYFTKDAQHILDGFTKLEGMIVGPEIVQHENLQEFWIRIALWLSGTYDASNPPRACPALEILEFVVTSKPDTYGNKVFLHIMYNSFGHATCIALPGSALSDYITNPHAFTQAAFNRLVSVYMD